MRSVPAPPPAAYCARLPAAAAALPAAHTPRRLLSACFAGADTPDRQAVGLGASTGGGALGSHTQRIADTPRAMANHGCDGPGSSTTVRTRARLWRAGKCCYRLEAPNTPVTRDKHATASTP